MRVIPVPCLRDNYAYLVVTDTGGQAAVVDPSEAAPVRAALVREELTLGAILCTHHHGDHVGGVEELLAPGMRVYAHESETERIPWMTTRLAHAQRFVIGRISITALHVPGHTSGALAFVMNDYDVFTGDTMFVSGCGRLFEGTPQMMHDSLHQKLGSLQGTARIWPGHEYGEKNLRFALDVEPGNSNAHSRLDALRQRMEEKNIAPGIPSTLEQERDCNPFFRLESSAVRAFARSHGAQSDDPVEIFRALRACRDDF